MQPETDQDWTELAACRGVDIAVFVDMPAPIRTKEQWSEAAALCARCVVSEECLAQGVQYGDAWTFRAGLTPLELISKLDPGYEPEATDEHHRERLCKRKLQRLRGRTVLGPSPSRHNRGARASSGTPMHHR